MGRAGRARAERQFSLQGMISGYERLYVEIAGWTGGSASAAGVALAPRRGGAAERA
jgi:hypothetical protein